MPYANANGIKLYYEETGQGTPIIFAHEFAGDYRSWEPQVRYFSRRYRCITYSARGYPPSDITDNPDQHGQDIVADDIGHVLTHLGIDKAHVVGLSMGGFATLHFGLRHPDRALSLVVAGCGYGADKHNRERFLEEVEAAAAAFDEHGAEHAAKSYAIGPTRVQFQNKDPRGWQEFADQLGEHSAKGSANTLRGYMKTRPSLYDLEPQLRDLTVPTLIVTGDEDEPCLDADVYLKRAIPSAGLLVIPQSGHTINLEEPDMFNRSVADFLASVDAGRWMLRDPRSKTGAILGSKR